MGSQGSPKSSWYDGLRTETKVFTQVFQFMKRGVALRLMTVTVLGRTRVLWAGLCRKSNCPTQLKAVSNVCSQCFSSDVRSFMPREVIASSLYAWSQPTAWSLAHTHFSSLELWGWQHVSAISSNSVHEFGCIKSSKGIRKSASQLCNYQPRFVFNT